MVRDSPMTRGGEREMGGGETEDSQAVARGGIVEG